MPQRLRRLPKRAKKQTETEAQATQKQANAANRNESRSSVTYSDASGLVSRWCRCLYRPCVFFDRTEHGLHRIGQSSVGGPWYYLPRLA